MLAVMFGSSSSFGAKPSIFGSTTTTTTTTNPNAEDIADGTKIFIAAGDKEVRLWDLASNQVAVVGTHDGPVKTCHWIKGNNYSCLMTGSWDKTLRFWDMRQLPTQSSLANITLPERVYCADVLYPMAAVGLANRHIKVYNLENGPQEVKNIESQLKFQLPERVYCADVLYPMAAVGLANRHIKVYNLENGPQEVKNIESQLKFQLFYPIKDQ
ncbi:WD domain, G-beta repeat protein [Teladorsagia circumcincta]|uniref:WD domain, G-beta repeat protein n=1 Tax=Teladorsagia circumcincta TaxID=45464 RepID=A0A2G9UFD3_TELCI|nr:WD domain, G-beta repeat protein [Teladorsagia circumcincta]